MIENLLNTPCTIVFNSRAETTEDDYGNEIPTDPPQVETTCYLEPQRRDEPETQGELSETWWLGVFRREDEFTTADQVISEDFGTFEAIGDPGPFIDPLGNPGADHVEATLKRTERPEAGS